MDYSDSLDCYSNSLYGYLDSLSSSGYLDSYNSGYLDQRNLDPRNLDLRKSDSGSSDLHSSDPRNLDLFSFDCLNNCSYCSSDLNICSFGCC